MTMTDRGVQALSNKPRNTFGSWTVTDSVEICDGIRSCQITWCSVFDLAFFRPSAYRCTLPYAFRFLCLRLHRGSLFLKDEP
jgi:hypothetical protein